MVSHSNIMKTMAVTLRKYTTKVLLNEEVVANIEKNVYKSKCHPGKMKINAVSLPNQLVKAIENIAEDYPVKALLTDGDILSRYLHFRLPPVEKNEQQLIKEEVEGMVLSKMNNVVISNERDEQTLKQSVKDKVHYLLKQRLYNWNQVNYDAYTSLVYLIARVAPNFAVLLKIFKEISLRDNNFKPRSLFDFGSGVGTVTWAANLYWKPHLFEYFNVDCSGDMNELAQILLQGGRGTKQPVLKGVFYRQFLPASNVQYDLVVSAYSLLELPSFKSRMQTILNLWNKTSKYLVIVENGTKAGFEVINQVRDYILNIENETNKGHVFSPCPHDAICPRFLSNDVPCNYFVQYFTLSIASTSECRKELYSYVILKKGKRDENDPRWPRAVKEVLVRSKHTICRLCTSGGKLEEVIFTASKHGKTTYHCARATRWGDLLPVSLEEKETEKK